MMTCRTFATPEDAAAAMRAEGHEADARSIEVDAEYLRREQAHLRIVKCLRCAPLYRAAAMARLDQVQAELEHRP